MAYTPGTHTAMALLNTGLPFDAVIAGLVAEAGYSTDDATRAVTAATAAKKRRGKSAQS